MKTVKEIKQEMVNISADHLMKQRKESVCSVDPNTCKYRGENGLSCAAAPFIEIYTPEIEGKSFRSLVKYYFHRLIPLIRETPEEFKGTISELGNSLQAIHDTCDVFIWPTCINKLCKEEGLQTPASVVEALKYGDNWVEDMPQCEN